MLSPHQKCLARPFYIQSECTDAFTQKCPSNSQLHEIIRYIFWNVIRYECMKPGKELHEAWNPQVGQACSRRTDLLRLLMSAWHYGKENSPEPFSLPFLSCRTKSSWLSCSGKRQWKRDWDWERDCQQEFVVLDYKNRSFVLSNRLGQRVQLVMEKVWFQDVRVRLLLERESVGHNNWQYQAKGKKKVACICRDPFHYVVRQ